MSKNFTLNSFAGIKTVASAIAKATELGSNTAKFASGNFQVWMLAVSTAALFKADEEGEKSVGHQLYKAYGKAQNDDPLCTRKVDLTNANVVKNKVAQVNAFANLSRRYGAADAFAFIDGAVNFLRSPTGGGFVADKVLSLCVAANGAKDGASLMSDGDVRKFFTQKAEAKAEKTEAKKVEAKKAEKAAKTFASLSAELAASADAYAALLRGAEKAFFERIAAQIAKEAAPLLKAKPKAEAKGNGKAPVKAKAVTAPRVDASLN